MDFSSKDILSIFVFLFAIVPFFHTIYFQFRVRSYVNLREEQLQKVLNFGDSEKNYMADQSVVDGNLAKLISGLESKTDQWLPWKVSAGLLAIILGSLRDFFF